MLLENECGSLEILLTSSFHVLEHLLILFSSEFLHVIFIE